MIVPTDLKVGDRVWRRDSLEDPTSKLHGTVTAIVGATPDCQGIQIPLFTVKWDTIEAPHAGYLRVSLTKEAA